MATPEGSQYRVDAPRDPDPEYSAPLRPVGAGGGQAYTSSFYADPFYGAVQFQQEPQANGVAGQQDEPNGAGQQEPSGDEGLLLQKDMDEKIRRGFGLRVLKWLTLMLGWSTTVVFATKLYIRQTYLLPYQNKTAEWLDSWRTQEPREWTLYTGEGRTQSFRLDKISDFIPLDPVTRKVDWRPEFNPDSRYHRDNWKLRGSVDVESWGALKDEQLVAMTLDFPDHIRWMYLVGLLWFWGAHLGWAGIMLFSVCGCRGAEKICRKKPFAVGCAVLVATGTGTMVSAMAVGMRSITDMGVVSALLFLFVFALWIFANCTKIDLTGRASAFFTLTTLVLIPTASIALLLLFTAVISSPKAEPFKTEIGVDFMPLWPCAYLLVNFIPLALASPLVLGGKDRCARYSVDDHVCAAINLSSPVLLIATLCRVPACCRLCGRGVVCMIDRIKN